MLIYSTQDLSVEEMGTVRAELVEIDADIEFGNRIERRGLAFEVWQFVIETDWSSVRDELFASALGAGAAAGVSRTRVAASTLARKFTRVRGVMPSDTNGSIEIRDWKAGRLIVINSEEATKAEPWEKLMELPGSLQGRLEWDSTSLEWRHDDAG